MRQDVNTGTGKTLNIPTRMFKPSDLSDMQVDFVEKQMLFNKAKYNEQFPEVGEETSNSMPVINYPDCSNVQFSENILADVVGKQFNASGDFIILPYFKDETEYDIGVKLSLAKRLKAQTEKEIIMEISYKTEKTVMDRIVSSSEDFDCVSIFYGVHFGRFPSFQKICERIVYLRRETGKKVFCTGVPLMFSEDRKVVNSVLLPIWDLVCDGWVKNWRRGGGATEIRLIDFVDKKNKNLMEWLKSHTYGEEVKYVNVSVCSLFQDGKDDSQRREIYTKMLVDEELNEVASITPTNMEEYMIRRCPPIYQTLVLTSYIEKLIQRNTRKESWSIYNRDELNLLADCLRKTFSPKALEKEIMSIESMVEEKVPVEMLITTVNKLRMG